MSIYLINRSICSSWPDKTPEEIWRGRKVNLAHLKIVGSTVMVHVQKQKRQKLDYKSQKLIFIGYDNSSKVYRCIDKATRKLTITRDVTRETMCELNVDITEKSTINDEFMNENVDAEPVREIDEERIVPENQNASPTLIDDTPPGHFQ